MSISQLSGLEQLDIREVAFSDHQIPDWVWLLPNLRILELRNNSIVGRISPNIGRATKLVTLIITRQQIHGAIPEELYQLENLKYVALTANQLSGIISPAIGQLEKLEHFIVFNNQLEGSIPTSIGKCDSLLTINLANNPLSGRIPDELYQCKKLQKLELYNTDIGGQLKETISNWTKMVELRLFNTPLQGEIPASIGDLDSLKVLDLRNSFVSGEIPVSVNGLPNLTVVRLGQTQLRGKVPPFTKADQLERLVLAKANFSGSIPLSIFQKQKLSEFTLDHNRFTFADIEPLLAEGVIDPSTFTSYAIQAPIPIQRAGNKLYVEAGGRIADNTYYWYRDGSLVKTVKGDSTLIAEESGIYHCKVQHAKITKPEVWNFNLTLNSEGLDANSCAGACVFPGDTNSDGQVDMIDWLLMSTSLGLQGPTRMEQGIGWSAKPSSDWSSNTTVAGTSIEHKHLDANGDGTINILDTEAIDVNFGNIHDQAFYSPLNIEPTTELDIEAVVKPIQPVGGGGNVSVELRLKGNESILGAAITIDYRTANKQLNIGSTDFCISDSEALKLVKNDTINGRITFGLIHKEGATNSCDSVLMAEMIIVVEDVIAIDTSDLLLVDRRLSYCRMVRLWAAAPIQAQIAQSLDMPTDIKEASSEVIIDIFPNPTRDYIAFRNDDQNLGPVYLEIFNTAGLRVLSTKQEWSGQQVDVSALPKGIYFLKARGKEETYIGKFIKQ